MDFYTYLIDIQSLDLVIKRHLDLINDEQRRLTFIESQKNKRLGKYEECKIKKSDYKDQLILWEKELFSIDDKLEKSKSHLSMATTEQQVKALEKEISELEPSKDELEEKILVRIDEIDELEKSIEEDEIYFKGVEETLSEIKAEIKTIEDQEKKEIEKLESQINGLLSEIPTHEKDQFLRARDKNRFDSPVTHLNATSCSKCRLQISAVEADEINNKKQLSNCKGCGRLLISKNFF